MGVLDEVGSLTHTEKHFLPARCGQFALAIESTEIWFPCKHIQVLELFVLWHTHKSQFLLYSQRSNRISVGTYVKVFILWSCQVVLSQLIQWLLLQWPATTKQLVLYLLLFCFREWQLQLSPKTRFFEDDYCFKIHVVNNWYKLLLKFFSMGLVLIYQSWGHYLIQHQIKGIFWDNKKMVTTPVVPQAFIALLDQNYSQKKTPLPLLAQT